MPDKKEDKKVGPLSMLKFNQAQEQTHPTQKQPENISILVFLKGCAKKTMAHIFISEFCVCTLALSHSKVSFYSLIISKDS